MPVPYGSLLHITSTNYHLLADKHEPYQRAHLLEKNIETFSGGKKVRKRASRQEEDKTERTMGVGRKNNGSRQKEQWEQAERTMGVGRRRREEIVNWNQMTALRFQTGGRH